MENSKSINYKMDDTKKFEPIHLRLARIQKLNNDYVPSMIDSCAIETM